MLGLLFRSRCILMRGEELYKCVSEGMKVEPGVGDDLRMGANPAETIMIATVAKVFKDLAGETTDGAKGKVARMLKECMTGRVTVEKGLGVRLQEAMEGDPKDHIRRTILADVCDWVAGVSTKKGKVKGQIAEAVKEIENAPKKG